MHEMYGMPGSEAIYGFQFVMQVDERLRQIPPEAAAQSDPSELIDFMQQLPNSVEGWRARGVNVPSEDDAVRIRGESVLFVIDHVARQPSDAFVQSFLRAIDATGQLSGANPPIDAELLPVVFARTSNSRNSAENARFTIVQWAAAKLDDEALRRSVGRLNEEARTSIKEAGVYDARVLQAIAEVEMAYQAADEQRMVAAATSKVRLKAMQEAQKRASDEHYALEAAAIKTLMQAKDAADFWQGYATFSEYFPSPDDYRETAEPAQQARLFGQWRRRHVEQRSFALAANILQELRPGEGETTAAPEGCQDVIFNIEPSAGAVFPNLDTLIAAMDDFYIPKGADGKPLEKYFPYSLGANKQIVDELLLALRQWAESDDPDMFKDPMHDAARGGLGDLLDYRGSALEDTDIQVTRRPDGGFVLNQADVGLYAGAEITFGSAADLEYHPSIPAERADDERIQFESSGKFATLRTIDNLPTDAIARHIKNTLEPGAAPAVEQAIHEGIVRPQQPHSYFKPETTLAVGGATISMNFEFHNPNSWMYVAPDPATGIYTKTRAVIFDEAPKERYSTPGIKVRYKGLSAPQASVVWAMAQQARQRQLAEWESR